MKEVKDEKITYEEAVKIICEKEKITSDEAKYNINILSHRMVNLSNKMKEDSEKENSWDELLENNEHELMIDEIEMKTLIKRFMGKNIIEVNYFDFDNLLNSYCTEINNE